MNFKKTLSLILAIIMIVALGACAGKNNNDITVIDANAATTNADGDLVLPEGEPVEAAKITIFAPESSVLFMMTAISKFNEVYPSLTVTISFEDSVVNTEKVTSGYSCDILVVDNSELLDFIDKKGGKVNTYKLDLVRSDSRQDICTAEIEGLDEPLVFSAGILKKAKDAEACQLFLDFLMTCGDDVFAEYGYTKLV